MFGTKRLKKKSQSVDISGPGCNPVAAEAQTPQPSKPSLATKTAASEEEQNNAANTQRRNPRRSELKRYYTIGFIPVHTELCSELWITIHNAGKAAGNSEEIDNLLRVIEEEEDQKGRSRAVRPPALQIMTNKDVHPRPTVLPEYLPK